MLFIGHLDQTFSDWYCLNVHVTGGKFKQSPTGNLSFYVFHENIVWIWERALLQGRSQTEKSAFGG